MKQRLWLAILYLIPMGLLAQTGTITGTLTDASTNEGLAFANVFNLTSITGTITDLDGNYELSATVGNRNCNRKNESCTQFCILST